MRATLAEYARAMQARDWAALCDRVLDPRLTARAGRQCPVAVGKALGDVRDPALVVGAVRITGDRARAEVRTSAAGQPPSRDTVELMRRSAGWRISRLAGTAPPSPED